VICAGLRRAGRLLASARFATLLLAFVGAWSVVATLVPQGTASEPQVVAWASAHPILDPVARLLDLHQAFTAPVLLVCVLALAVSTALCAWERTKGANAKVRALRSARAADKVALVARHDLEIACDPRLSEHEVLSIASETLRRLGIKTKPQNDVITAVSSAWSVWGSPVFHWALFALIAVVLLGNLSRSSGLMGVAVGQSRPDQPGSYGLISAGPLRDWNGTQRTIRVDAFDLAFRDGGVGRGPTPTVSVLDAQGKLLKSQRVYPNHTLNVGSLTIYPADYGLTATVSLVDTTGVEAGRSVQFVDFAPKAEGGTAPVGFLKVSDAAGNAELRVYVSVPLDRVDGGLAGRLPEVPAARVLVTSPDGTTVLDRVLHPGEELALPTGGALRLAALGYYARLQVVDDPSIPFLYAGLAVAAIGLGVAAFARQQILSAAVVATPDGPRLAVRVRLWRNASSSRGEIETELARALDRVEKGSTT
jgi:cytochrome c biogenesis protein ResB